MTRSELVRVTLVALMTAPLLPVAASAQTGSVIAGKVTDSSGAVLPGVTVEAKSPALIEQVRTVVTDGEGVYRIIGLQPGTYAVAFNLVGFTPVMRDAFQLEAAFTATLNVEMRVGGLEETVTVSGAAPLVDVQTVQQRRVLEGTTLESIQASVRSPAIYTSFLPGVIVDTSNSAEPFRDQRRASLRGASSTDNVEMLDGFNYAMLNRRWRRRSQSVSFVNMGVRSGARRRHQRAGDRQSVRRHGDDVIPRTGRTRSMAISWSSIPTNT